MRIALAALVLAAGIGRDDFKEAAARLAQAMAAGDYTRIADALKSFPESDPRTPKHLFDTLRGAGWWLKGSIVEALGKPPFLKALVDEIEQGKRKEVQEACATALEALDGEGVVPALAKALGDPDWRIRRAATMSLGARFSRERIDALVARLAEEKDTGVLHLIAGRLTLRTRQTFGTNAEAWAAWWKANRDAAKDSGESKSGEVEFKDFRIKYETIAAPDSRFGIVVLPDFPARPDYFRPHLDFLSAYGNLHYLRLPDPKTLATERSATGNPIYPVENLVGALEKLRSECREEKLLFIGHGATVWLAMAYARDHVKTVSGLIFFGAYVDDDSFVSASGRAKAAAVQRKDTFLEEVANWRMGKIKLDFKKGHELAIFSEFAGDPGELALSRVYATYFEDYRGAVTVPDVRSLFSQPIPTPALFVYGRHDAFSGAPEFQRSSKYLSAAQAVVFDASGALPFLSESNKFTKSLSDFAARIAKKR